MDGKPYLQRANEQGTVIDSIFACLSYVFKHTSAGSSKKTTALIWTPSRRVQICRFPGHGLYCFGVGNKQRATVKWTWLIWQLHGEMDWHFVPLYIASDRIWCKTWVQKALDPKMCLFSQANTFHAVCIFFLSLVPVEMRYCLIVLYCTLFLLL